MGVLNLNHMNISLLLKWWWKLKDPNFHSLWKDLIVMKYGTSRDKSKFSAFWKEIVALDPIGNVSKYFIWGNGKNICFWEDIWLGENSLATSYPHLYSIVNNKKITLHEVIQHQGRNISFNRNISGMLYVDWHEILSQIPAFYCDFDDQIQFRWSSNGIFTTKAMYDFINFRGILVTDTIIWWTIPIPYKIKIFMWLAHNSKILTKDNLMKRGWTGRDSCCFCIHMETTTHLLLTCSFVRKIWFWMGKFRTLFENWQSFQDLIQYTHSISHIQAQACLLVFSAVCWTVWLTRNNICFQRKTGYNNSIRSILIQICSTVKYWREGVKNEAVKMELEQWMPQEWDEIPLQELVPLDQLTNAVMESDAVMSKSLVAI